MKEIDGLYFPDADTHFEELCRRKGIKVAQYQTDRIAAAIVYSLDVAGSDVCIEVGAHVGIHTRLLAAQFKQVYAIEAHPLNYECLVRNTLDLDNVTTLASAITAKDGETRIDNPVDGNTGNLQIGGNGPRVPGVTLDSLGLPIPDLLKIDVQGAELRVLSGARRLLIAGSPAVLFEEEPPGKLRRALAKSNAAQTYLLKLGGKIVWTAGADAIATFPDGAWPYTKYSEQGEYHWKHYESGKFRVIIDWVGCYVGSKNHDSIVDIGCGDGVWSGVINLHASNLDGKTPAFGIDRDTRAIQCAKQRSVPVHVGSAHRLSKFDFDAALLVDVLEHIPWPERVIGDLRRRSIRDVYVVNPDPNGSRWHINEFEQDEMSDAFERQGYRVERREDFIITSRNHKTFFHFRLDE